MTRSDALVQDFVLSYLKEIEAEVSESEGVYHVQFPLGRKRRFGGERRIVFDPAKSQPQVELLEPGSPLLKLLVLDAMQFGGLGLYYSAEYAPGTLVFTFQLSTYSSLKRRTRFVTASLLPEATTPRLADGIPEFFEAGNLVEVATSRDVERAQNALAMVLPTVEAAALEFAQEAVKESHEGFHKSLGRVSEYFQGLRQETFSEEARIRKRLGEIQSKLYFTEDGLRELKLEKERERLTQELHTLKKRHTQAEEKLLSDQSEHVDRQRRRHEPKLRVRLVAATLLLAARPPSPVVVPFHEPEEQGSVPVPLPPAPPAAEE